MTDRETPKDIGVPTQPKPESDQVPSGQIDKVREGAKASYKTDILTPRRGHGG